MSDPRQKEHLALAREAGTRAMAKDFFAPTPGPAQEVEATEGAMPPEAGAEGGMPPELAELSPEQLEELLALLGQQNEEPPVE